VVSSFGNLFFSEKILKNSHFLSIPLFIITMSGIGRVAIKRQMEVDIQRAADELSNSKRQKLNLTTSNGAESNPSPASSKCAPLSPLPEKREGTSDAIIKKPIQNVQSIGPYRLLAPLEENPNAFTAVDTRRDGRLVICRRLDRSKYTHMMQLSHRLTSAVNDITVEDEEASKRAYQQIFPATSELMTGDDGHIYHFEPKNHGSLHAYVVQRKRLSEQECLWFFRQIATLLVYCHRRGVVLRDLKLRKFVFADAEQRTIRLDSIDELFVCPEKNVSDDEEGGYYDKISDRHGCPAYVGPEILDLNQKAFSGWAADMWSVGVLLYVMLYGRYPFYDTTPARLFAKIRHAQIHLVEEAAVSYEARSLIRCLLRRDPTERPSSMDMLAHPWLQSGDRFKYTARRHCGSVINTPTGLRLVLVEKDVDTDQCVPTVNMEKHDQSNKVKGVNAREVRRLDVVQPAVPSQ